MKQKVGTASLCDQHDLIITFKKGIDCLIGNVESQVVISGNEDTLDNGYIMQGEVINTIFDGRTFKTDYINKDNNNMHFGTIYGNLSYDEKRIKGEFLGYGMMNGMFVSGEVILYKH